MFLQWSKPFPGLPACLRVAPIYLHIRCDESAQQPRPDCSLVIRAVALSRTTGIAAAVLRITRRQAPQPHRREPMLLDFVHPCSRPPHFQHGLWEGALAK